MTGWTKLVSTGGDMRSVLAEWVADTFSCVDPYWLMAEAMDFAAFAKPVRATGHKLPVLVEKTRGADERFALEAHSRDELRQLINRIGPAGLRRFQLAAPRTAGINEVAPPEQNARVGEPESESSSDTPCAMHFGVIDEGFPFVHANLLRQDGRPLVSSIWDQTDGAASRVGWEALELGDGGFGGLLRREAIEAVMAACQRPQGLDEVRVYTETEYRVNQPGVPHGCGVTHMLAGRNVGLPDGSRTESPLACNDIHCVQLPADGTLEDTAGGWLGYYALAGIRHIIRSIQQETQGPWRAIINLSYGSIAGPHDGTSMFEEAIDATRLRYDSVRTGAIDIVVAAGNTRGKRIHAQRDIGPEHPGSFRFFTPPDNPRESYLELWIPNMADDRPPAGIGITVTAPTGAEITVQAGEAHLLKLLSDEAPCAGIVFSHRVAQGRNGTMFLLLVRPTQTAGQSGRAPAGVWELNVTAGHSVTIHGWVERNDMVVHNRRNQQARFVEDPDDPRHVNDDLTFSSAAGSKMAVVVGAVRQSDGVMTDYCGIDLRDPEAKPDWFAASDMSPAMPGVLVPGFYSGTTTRMSGTSVAAPRVARWLATAKREKEPRPTKPREPPPPGEVPSALERPIKRTIL